MAKERPRKTEPLAYPGWFIHFLADRTIRKLSPHTAKAYRQDFEAIAVLLAGAADGVVDIKTADLDSDNLRAAFAVYAETHSAASIRRCWSTWNTLCTFLYTAELLAANPMPLIGRPKVPKSLPKSYSTDDGGVLQVRGKGNKDRRIPFSAELLDIFDQYLRSRTTRLPQSRGRPLNPGDPMRRFSPTAPLFVGADGERITRGALQYRILRAFKKAGIDGERASGALVHGLRHTFATELANANVSVYTLMKLLGHESMVTSNVTSTVLAPIPGSPLNSTPSTNLWREIYRHEIRQPASAAVGLHSDSELMSVNLQHVGYPRCLAGNSSCTAAADDSRYAQRTGLSLATVFPGMAEPAHASLSMNQRCCTGRNAIGTSSSLSGT